MYVFGNFCHQFYQYYHNHHHNYHFNHHHHYLYFFLSYAQNVVFDVRTKRTKLPELRGGGGGREGGTPPTKFAGPGLPAPLPPPLSSPTRKVLPPGTISPTRKTPHGAPHISQNPRPTEPHAAHRRAARAPVMGALCPPPPHFQVRVVGPAVKVYLDLLHVEVA